MNKELKEIILDYIGALNIRRIKSKKILINEIRYNFNIGEIDKEILKDKDIHFAIDNILNKKKDDIKESYSFFEDPLDSYKHYFKYKTKVVVGDSGIEVTTVNAQKISEKEEVHKNMLTEAFKASYDNVETSYNKTLDPITSIKKTIKKNLKKTNI